ncbi:MAG: hypothetical protein JXJ04_02750 [Spirochaetales bacterium]|nr:hypothetical protein [Spirochaetales bacterium]
MKGINISRMNVLIAMVFILSMGMGYGQVHIDLGIPNSIPCYCQETGFWCGAAVGQMILQGYPGGLEFPNTQADVWSTIQLYKNDPGVPWFTDPDGLRGALMDLGSSPGVNWVVYAKPDKTKLMYSVAYWMNKREYPVAILINDWAHWVNIVAIETDVDPLTNTTVNLQWIKIYDPASPWGCPSAVSGGVTTSMTGAAWYNPVNNYLDNPGNYPASKWNGNFIAVIEPPKQDGIVLAPKIEVVQKGRILPPEVIMEYTYKWIKKYNLFEDRTYSSFRNLNPLEPILVNKSFGAYYIVPFGFPEDNIAQGSLILNAYTGDFEQIGAYKKPGTYLSEKEAVRKALNYLKCGCNAYVEKAELKYIYSSQSANRFSPVWEVQIYADDLINENTDILYVTNLGDVLEHLTFRTFGD